MPRYDYKCRNDNCDMDIFEAEQRITEEAKYKCPLCNSVCNRVIVATGGFMNKSGGFYKNSNVN